MRREIVLDTETTGFSANHGHRIVSIAAIELIDGQPTGDFIHTYLNPERESDPGALAIHGLTTAFLADKPKFADVAQTFLDYFSGDSLVIHNAPFDVSFLLAEFGLAGYVRPSLPVTCTLNMARNARGWKAANKLDNLVADFGIANLRGSTGRHGALVDALLLVNVYQALRGHPITVLDAGWLTHYGVVDESVGSQASQNSSADTQAGVAGTETGGSSTGVGEVLGGDNPVHNSIEDGSANGGRAAQGTVDGAGEQLPGLAVSEIIRGDAQLQ